jgi:ferredoxin
MIFYFSGLGNSRHVAEGLTEEGERLLFIPDAERAGCYDYAVGMEERLGFVFPVYSWRAPRLVSDFVRKLRIEGRPGYTFMVATCGDDCGRTEHYFRQDLRRKGLNLDTALAIQMPNTYVCLPGMDVDPTPLAEEKLARAEERIAQVKALLRRRERVSQMIVTGMAGLKSDVVQPLFYSLLVKDKPFHSSEACVSCGICAKSCPLQNIVMVDGRPQWQGHCTTCLACYHHCPQHAIHYGRATDKKGQYYFGNDTKK